MSLATIVFYGVFLLVGYAVGRAIIDVICWLIERINQFKER